MIVKEIKLGSTNIKFCDDCIVTNDEQRIEKIKNFKQSYLELMKGVKIDE